MLKTFLLLIMLFTTTWANQEPMVAFMCDKPTMYLSAAGWLRDDTTNCLKNPADILAYCKKMYPLLDVRNIVESTKEVLIQKWCNFGQDTCVDHFTVLPFRCLVGKFQSDALLVPEGCVFDHIHDSGRCSPPSFWDTTSSYSCNSRKMVRDTYAMLQPCGVDVFQGVEFVCCPAHQDQIFVASTTAVIKPLDEDVVIGDSTSSIDDDTNIDMARDAVMREYIEWGGKRKRVPEHELYIKAKNGMSKLHHDKVAKMMKDWAAARKRVEDLKTIDPEASEKLNKDVLSKFQKMYENEERDSEMERQEVDSLHEHRIMQQFDYKRANIFDKFVDVVEAEEPEFNVIVKTLRRFIKVLEKERVRIINRLKRLNRIQEEEGINEGVSSDIGIQSRINSMDDSLNEAISMLDQVPKFKNKILKQIDDYLETYHLMDSDFTELISRSTSTLTHTVVTKATKDSFDFKDSRFEDDDYKDEVIVEEVSTNKLPNNVMINKDTKISTKIDSASSDSVDGLINFVTRGGLEKNVNDIKIDAASSVDGDGDEESEDADRLKTVRPLDLISVTKNTISVTSTTANMLDDYINDDMMSENEKIVPQPDHIQIDSLHAKQLELKKTGKKGPANSFPGGVIIAAVICLCLVVLVAVVVVKKREERRKGLFPLSLDLDPSASPEESHLASMQINGYENPTYKFFEMNQQA